MRLIRKFLLCANLLLVFSLFASSLSPAGPVSIAKAARQPQSPLPVILLPGMTASVNWSCFLAEQECANAAAWGWSPTAQGYYQPLIDRLGQLGYSEANHYFSVFFYDWRRPLAENAARLQAHIDQVQAATAASQVDLVGHSMGGLVARAYVQSDLYGADVAHLATLGSPHYGAARSYAYWEAANLYQMGTVEKLLFGTLLLYYSIQQYNPLPVFVLRSKVPSTRDLLPILDYLYEGDSNLVIAENSLIHRNGYLAGLNADLAALFARTQVATFVGQDSLTAARFYVDPRPFWEWPNWDDGKPNWAREGEFGSSLGDGTVLAASGLLPPPAVRQEFAGVSHGALPGDSAVIDALFSFLGISGSSAAPAAAQAPLLALYLLGPATARVTDPLGRVLEPPPAQAGSPNRRPQEAIPGAAYVQMPGDPFQLLIIPDPLDGQFQIAVTGEAAAPFALGLLETQDVSAQNETSAGSLWQVVDSYLGPGVTTTFALTFTESSPATFLTALTPVIDIPAWVGSSTVSGWSVPGATVTIYDVNQTFIPIGVGIADWQGRFAALLGVPLMLNQHIYAVAKGVQGVSVPVQSHMLYLPVTLRR